MENRTGNAGETNLLIAQASDGTSVRAEAEGEGRVILILHPGMDTGKSYAKVAARLARRYRVIRLHRRQYPVLATWTIRSRKRAFGLSSEASLSLSGELSHRSREESFSSTRENTGV